MSVRRPPRGKLPSERDDRTAPAEAFKRILSHARQVDRLERQLHALLPDSIAAHVRLCGRVGGELRLVADGAPWATRIRMMERALLGKLSRLSDFRDVDRVRVRVSEFPFAPPEDAVHRLPSPPRACLWRPAPSETAHFADGVRDPDLRDALDRLATGLSAGPSARR